MRGCRMSEPSRAAASGTLDRATCARYNICMNKQLKIIKVGNSAGVILPKEVLAHLRVAQGDNVYLAETPTGFHLTPTDPSFEKKMALAETIMREDRDILHVLAQ